MKKVFLITIVLGLVTLNITAQEPSQKDNALINDLFLSNLVINKQKIVSDTLTMVFKGTFYMVDPKIFSGEGEGSYSCRNLVNINEGVIFDRIDTGLVLLLKDNFFLKTEKDVIIFETALDKLYPIDDPEDQELKEHLKSGDIWYFIRGAFFDSKKAFKVTVDKDSKITGIVYDLKAIEAK
jgi:hypothetical protein